MAGNGSAQSKTARQVNKFDTFTVTGDPVHGNQDFVVVNAAVRLLIKGGSETDDEIDVAQILKGPNGTVTEIHIPPVTYRWSTFVAHASIPESMAPDLGHFLLLISGSKTLFKGNQVHVRIERTPGRIGTMYPGS